jgi:hypothetical protein
LVVMLSGSVTSVVSFAVIMMGGELNLHLQISTRIFED